MSGSEEGLPDDYEVGPRGREKVVPRPVKFGEPGWRISVTGPDGRANLASTKVITPEQLREGYLALNSSKRMPCPAPEPRPFQVICGLPDGNFLVVDPEAANG